MEYIFSLLVVYIGFGWQCMHGWTTRCHQNASVRISNDGASVRLFNVYALRSSLSPCPVVCRTALERCWHRQRHPHHHLQRRLLLLLLLSSPLIIHDLPFPPSQSLWPPSPRIVPTIEFPQSRPQYAVPCLEDLPAILSPPTTPLNVTAAGTTTRDSQHNAPLPPTPRAPPRPSRLSVMSTIIQPGIKQVTRTLPALQNLSPGRHPCLPSRTSSAEPQSARAA